MPESETQKQGVAALGCRFSEKVEHVPIKKRRFMLRSPSPPPVIVSPTPEETAVPTKSEDISNRQVASNSITCENNLDRNIDNNISTDLKNPDNSNGKFGQDDDFSGISILAAAACSSSVGREYAYAEDRKVVKESPVLYSAPEVCTNTKARLFSKKILKEEFLSSSEMSTGGTLSCISTEPAGEPASNTVATCKPQEVIADGKYIKDIVKLTDSLPSSGKASCSKDEDMLDSQQPSSRDERFHWDLNVVMDAWEEPINDKDVHNYGPHGMSEDATNDKHDLHGKTTAACAEQSLSIPGEPQPSSFQASGGSKSKQDENVRHYVDQNVRLGEKSIVSNSNYNLDVVKCSVNEPKSTDCQNMYSGDLNDADNTATRTLHLKREKRHYDPNCAISMGSSETPLVTPNESRDSILAATSKTSLRKCMRYPKREENGVDAEYIDDVGARSDAIAGTGVAGEVQDDYDSQYEDGELRESTECAWDEYDGADREYDYVDYGSDNISACINNHSDYHDSEPGQVEGTKNERRSLASFGGGYDDDNKVCKHAAKGVENDTENIIDNHENPGLSALEKTELPRGTEQRESSKSCSDMVTGVTDDGRKARLPSHLDELVASKGTETHDEPKMFRRPISRDGTSRDVRPYRMENRFDSGSTRSFERGRHSYHNQGRGRHNGSWDGPSDYRRGYKRQYSPVNYRRSKLGDDAALERDSLGCDGRRDGLSFSHQHPNTRTNAIEEPCPSLQPRFNRPDRKFSPDRGAAFGRGRPFRYGPPVNDTREGRGRGRGRGRYNSGPSSNESFQSSLKYRRPLSCRDRSHSPFEGRGQSNMYHSRGRSPSRSRSRSPVVWDSPRDRPGPGRGGRNFIRHRSRSPNFRPDVRMQRLRSPNQQPNFGNRWNSGRKDEMEQFGEFGYKQRTNTLERSPGKFRPRGDRDRDRDSIIDSPRNRKPDGYLKFSDRISEDGAGRGGVRYADTYEDRRKHNNFLRPARQSYEDGMGSRLHHHDTDDGFSNTNDFRNRDGPRFRGRGGFRGTDRRIGDMRRSFNGEHQTFAYEKSDKFNSNSKEFTVDMMDKSFRRDRYANMDGSNQGPRHDNYDNKRRQYNSTNFMQHSDNQTFQDSPDFGAIICEQEEKHDNLNSQLNGVKSSENDAIIGSAPS